MQNIAYTIEVVRESEIDIQPYLEKAELFSLLNDFPNKALVIDADFAVLRFSKDILQKELCRFEVEEAMVQWKYL